MKRWLMALAVLGLVAAACGDSGEAPAPTEAEAPQPAGTQPASTEAAAATGSVGDLAITEVVFEDHLTITNLGADPVSVDGLWICNRPNYLPLPATVVAPGESIEISGDDFPLRPDGGEVALYTANTFSDSSAMVDYVAWGDGGGRGAVAVAAGLWPADDTVAAGSSGITAPGGGSSPSDWSSE